MTTTIQNIQSFSTFITQFQTDINKLINNWNFESFKKQQFDTSETLISRGKIYLQNVIETKGNLETILNNKNTITQFFSECESILNTLTNENNNIIDIITNEMKNQRENKEITDDQYFHMRNEWNQKRIESETDKTKRECQELLYEIQNERKRLEETKQSIDETTKQFSNEYQHLEEKVKILKMKEFNISPDQIKQLEDWTSLSCGDILFDSDKDNWNVNTSILNEKIIGKKQLIFLIETDESEKFGSFINCQIERKYSKQELDDKSFLFNLQSNNNRLSQPKKFEMKTNLDKSSNKNANIQLLQESNDLLISFSDFNLYKQSKRHYSYCIQENDKSSFDYQNINKALCGKSNVKERFIPRRILIIQMK